MALIEVETKDGPRKVRVCDYCKCVCIPRGRFCSGRCSRSYYEMIRLQDNRPKEDANGN
jgi:hypothetical protein